MESRSDAENLEIMQPKHELKFRCITGGFAVCRLPGEAALPDWAMSGIFTSITRTPDELSIVCPAESVPEGVQADKGWTCFKLEGPFPFSQTGILTSFIDPLSERGVPIFAVATFDTDYVLIKEEFVDMALDALGDAGHERWPRDESRRKLGE
jgi:hypothetical protein